MNKQIKKLACRIMLGVVTFSTLGCVMTASASDVVESISIIEEHNITPITGTTAPIQDEEVIVIEVPEQEKKQIEYKTGWTTANVNVREFPNLDSPIYAVYEFNTQIEYSEYNDQWVLIRYNEGVAYVSKQFVSDTKRDYIVKPIPPHPDFKSFMSYKAITSTGSKQYILQHSMAYTGQYGIRQINGRYCVAIGSYLNTSIGQYFDLVLENGEVIPCIMADLKADKDTDSNNLFTAHNGCCSEFIVDSKALVASAKTTGSISYVCDEWNSPVVAINIYNNILG